MQLISRRWAGPLEGLRLTTSCWLNYSVRGEATRFALTCCLRECNRLRLR